MKQACDQLQTILPQSVRRDFLESDLQTLCEIRLRAGYPALFCFPGSRMRTGSPVTPEDLQFTVRAASRYSPWNAQSIREGYLTAPGGHRIGICGEAIPEGIRSVTSLNIRVARDLRNIAAGIPLTDSFLILGAPGAGKTTLLRDCIRRISRESRENISVVDERKEIFPFADGMPCFEPGAHTDILSGMSKKEGIPAVLRAMGPAWIAVDEITDPESCDALMQALWCGVRVIATAHAADLSDYLSRPVYRPLVRSRLFSRLCILNRDKSWTIREVTP